VGRSLIFQILKKCMKMVSNEKDAIYSYQLCDTLENEVCKAMKIVVILNPLTKLLEQT